MIDEMGERVTKCTTTETVNGETTTTTTITRADGTETVETHGTAPAALLPHHQGGGGSAQPRGAGGSNSSGDADVPSPWGVVRVPPASGPDSSASYAAPWSVKSLFGKLFG